MIKINDREKLDSILLGLKYFLEKNYFNKDIKDVSKKYIFYVNELYTHQFLLSCYHVDFLNLYEVVKSLFYNTEKMLAYVKELGSQTLLNIYKNIFNQVQQLSLLLEILGV